MSKNSNSKEEEAAAVAAKAEVEETEPLVPAVVSPAKVLMTARSLFQSIFGSVLDRFLDQL